MANTTAPGPKKLTSRNLCCLDFYHRKSILSLEENNLIVDTITASLNLGNQIKMRVDLKHKNVMTVILSFSRPDYVANGCF